MTDTAPITIRLLDMFRIGPGPSSSHTVGPMRAARTFRERCLADNIVPQSLRVELRGSLSATGRGHGTDRAVLAGLSGWLPETCDGDALDALPKQLEQHPVVAWGDVQVRLHPDDIVFRPQRELRQRDLPHPNTMLCVALGEDGQVLREETYCSVGGGFVQRPEELGTPFAASPPTPPPCPFHNGASLVAVAEAEGLGLGDVVLRNERAWESRPGATAERLDQVVEAFRDCIRRGLNAKGVLPGGLGMTRKARGLLERLQGGAIESTYQPIARAQAYAYAINEENAAGGRVVTAPTNGAAGIFPAVLIEAADRLSLSHDDVHRAIAAAGAIAMVIKTHASLSGAEVGCQGEVGSATAMAAAALCQIRGGSPAQVENAAEIGLEHNLGLTCDPIQGLVQAPCIERNAMGVAKAWSAAQLALHSEGSGVVSLDKVIQVMMRTGLDMAREYKETSEGGLAVAIPEC